MERSRTVRANRSHIGIVRDEQCCDFREPPGHGNAQRRVPSVVPGVRVDFAALEQTHRLCMIPRLYGGAKLLTNRVTFGGCFPWAFHFCCARACARARARVSALLS
eukprot:COSAG02_NODE_51132_length_316_cov_0.705069_1_plen_105_part_11